MLTPDSDPRCHNPRGNELKQWLGGSRGKRKGPQRVELRSLQRPQKATSSPSHSGHPEASCGTTGSPPTVGGHLKLWKGFILGLWLWESVFMLIVSCCSGRERNNPNRRNYFQKRRYLQCRQAHSTGCFPSVCPPLVSVARICSWHLCVNYQRLWVYVMLLTHLHTVLCNTLYRNQLKPLLSPPVSLLTEDVFVRFLLCEF